MASSAEGPGEPALLQPSAAVLGRVTESERPVVTEPTKSAAVTLQWPPALPDAARGMTHTKTVASSAGIRDPRLLAGIAEITTTLAAEMDGDGADVQNLIRTAAR